MRVQLFGKQNIQSLEYRMKNLDITDIISEMENHTFYLKRYKNPHIRSIWNSAFHMKSAIIVIQKKKVTVYRPQMTFLAGITKESFQEVVTVEIYWIECWESWVTNENELQSRTVEKDRKREIHASKSKWIGQLNKKNIYNLSLEISLLYQPFIIVK